MRLRLDVAPQTVQNVSTGRFPWYRGCHLRIRATGMIGSGVVCTGLTPPGGWGAWPVREDEFEWPCRGGLARRYGLIASLDDGTTWFFVGEGVTKFSLAPRAGSGPEATLRLAVNRPRLDRTAAGDRAWAVEVETVEPARGRIGPDPEACRAILSELAGLRTINAPNTCEEVGQARTALEERERQMEVAFEIAGGLAIALTIVATAPLIAQAIAEHGGQRAAIEAVRSILERALESANPVVGAISAAATAVAAVAGARSAATAARSASSPATANLILAIIIAGLIIAMVVAFVTAIAMVLSLLTLGADRDNAVSRWNSLINEVQSLLAFSREVCEPPFDETLPACAALGG